MPVAKLVQYMSVGPSCSTRPLLAVPPSHGNETAAGGRYRAHLRAVTANNGPLIVRSSGPRNLRPVRAWDTADVNLFSHSQMHPHAETLQFRMHDSTEMYVSSGSLASVVLVESVSRHHEEGSSPGIADKFSRSVGASWPDPLLLWRRMLLGSSRVHILRWCAATGPNALRNKDRCPWQSLFSICRWDRPVPHALSSPSHRATGMKLPLVADIVHTSARSRQITVRSSYGRVAHVIFAPSVHGTQRTLTFSVTLRCTRMPRHFNSACMTAPRCMYPPGPSHPSCWWKACPDTTKRAHPQASQTNILPSQITASASLTSSAGSVMG
ncbi:hypothetical protein TCSYLVIO_011030, partial [Trypanosoma cruzi]